VKEDWKDRSREQGRNKTGSYRRERKGLLLLYKVSVFGISPSRKEGSALAKKTINSKKRTQLPSFSIRKEPYSEDNDRKGTPMWLLVRVLHDLSAAGCRKKGSINYVVPG